MDWKALDWAVITTLTVTEAGYSDLLTQHGFPHGDGLLDTVTKHEVLTHGIVGAIGSVQIRCDGDAWGVYLNWRGVPALPEPEPEPVLEPGGSVDRVIAALEKKPELMAAVKARLCQDVRAVLAAVEDLLLGRSVAELGDEYKEVVTLGHTPDHVDEVWAQVDAVLDELWEPGT